MEHKGIKTKGKKLCLQLQGNGNKKMNPKYRFHEKICSSRAVT